MVEFISMVIPWSLFRKTYEATVLPSFETRMHSLTRLPLCMLTKKKQLKKLLKTITPVTIFLSDVPLPVSGVKGFLLESYSITCCVSLASLLTLASVASLCCSLVL